MRALWLEDRQLEFRDDAPEPDDAGGAEAVVRVTCAGVCATDLELVRGYYPFSGIPGHEFVGVVERGPDALRGRRVTGEINAVCGKCAACRAGRARHCTRRTVLGIVGRPGAFAERVALPPENLHAVPDHVPDDVAVFTEPLAAAVRIREQVALGREDRVLVVGDGRLGQLVARVLLLESAHVSVIGRHAAKLAMLGDLGASILPEEDCPPGEFDAVVECTGGAEGFAIARRAVRPLGTVVLKSTYAGDLTVDASALVVDEITVVGSRCGPFDPALRLLAEGRIDPRPLVQERYPLREGVAAFARSAERGVLKVLLDMEGA